MISGHVFIATSLDGYIARLDGDIDWLLQRDDPAEDHGYHDFIADKDVIVMGRGSFEKVLGFDPWPYDRPVLVLSRQLAGTPVPPGLADKVRFSNATPEQAMAQLSSEGVRRVYVDGGQLVQSFIRAGLVEDMVLTTVPVLIGAGRPLFGTLPQDLDLKLVASRSFPSGLVQSTYRFAP
ncbi:dihydrofolate reductase family protein [Massilia sp. 9I]|uniref:dihydrofolate reductase family protein n=1 Tax=Massilia sp. 9I TaxID=2653152 RepID=UPI0012EF4A4A|nr:dihydrofolate reductase family protein [Massilia sp. 9I]VXC70155.1 Dihydrofolate reductase homolog [Massilia sp. 9I]